MNKVMTRSIFLISVVAFLVGSVLTAKNINESGLEKKRIPENEYPEGVFNKKPRSSPSFDIFEDSSVKVSRILLQLPSNNESVLSQSIRERTHLLHQQEHGKDFDLRAPSPEPVDNSIPAENGREEKTDVDEPPSAVNPKLATWRKEFFSAIQANDSSRLESLQAELDDANFKIFSPVNPKIFTFPLHFALRHDLNDAVAFLITEGLFDPMAKDSFGHTALSLTIELGDYRNFIDLLENSDVHEIVRGDYNLTHLAASMNVISPIFLKALQRKGVDFTTRCHKNHWTPLQYAIAANNFVLALWLIENTPCNIGLRGNKTIVLDALMEGHEDLAIKLIEKGAKVDVCDASNRNILHIIAENNFLNVLDYIKLDKMTIYNMININDNVKGYCPAHYAAEKNNFDVLTWINEECDLNAKTRDGLSVIQVAISAGSAEVVQLMFDEDLFDWEDSYGWELPPILVIAYKTGHMGTMDVLLECLPENFHYLFDEKGLNVLHYAVIKNDVVLIDLLLEKYEFDPFYTENGLYEVPANSPFSWAIYFKNAIIVELFLKKKNKSFISERVRLSLFLLEEEADVVDPDDQDDVLDIEQLAYIFGDDAIVALIQQHKK